MMIHSFEGNQRGGKGIGIVSYALFQALLAYRITGKFPYIYANFHFTQYPYFRFFQEWDQIESVRNAIICYDEIGGTHDARLYNSKSQILFTNVFNQMGKMGNVFLYTCQREFQVEKRVREQTDFVIKCRKDHKTGLMYQSWIDVQGGREKPIFITAGRIIRPERFYNEYDTFEVVASKAKFDNVHAKSY